MTFVVYGKRFEPNLSMEMLQFLYKWTLSNQNLVQVLLALQFKSLWLGSLCLRSTCKYLGKRFICFSNRRKSLQPGFVAQKPAPGATTGVWKCCWQFFSFIYLPEIWRRKSLSTKLNHVQAFADNAQGKFTTLTFNEHNWWLWGVWLSARLICLWIPSVTVLSHLDFFFWSLLNWFLASLFDNLAEALQSGQEIGTMLSNQM